MIEARMSLMFFAACAALFALVWWADAPPRWRLRHITVQGACARAEVRTPAGRAQVYVGRRIGGAWLWTTPAGAWAPVELRPLLDAWAGSEVRP